MADTTASLLIFRVRRTLTPPITVGVSSRWCNPPAALVNTRWVAHPETVWDSEPGHTAEGESGLKLTAQGPMTSSLIACS
jgi:hypothetical protein